MLVDFLFQKCYTQNDLLNMQIKIEHFLEKYIEVTKNHLTPKFHNLLHYPMLTAQYGPLRNFTNDRHESKNKQRQ